MQSVLGDERDDLQIVVRPAVVRDGREMALFPTKLRPVAADQQASVLEKVRQGGLEQAFIVP